MVLQTATANRGHVRLSSIESLSALDGPGVRFVAFLQGCPLRCKYCHNPETWSHGGGQLASVDDVLNRFDRCRRLVSGIGLTLSGGEPLMQSEACLELLMAAKSRGIHTALDTSGCGNEDDLARLLRFVDIVLFDVKAVDQDLHREITGSSNEQIIRNMAVVSESGVKTWVRRVLIPGINDSPEEAMSLMSLIGQCEVVERVDVIPYHRMGLEKWRRLGMVCPYETVEMPDQQTIQRFCSLLADGCRGTDLTCGGMLAYHRREVSEVG